tara:strand:- start:1624 stop:1872 length:249 start_codon:yes stop_codon:yes gene_type:complete
LLVFPPGDSSASSVGLFFGYGSGYFSSRPYRYYLRSPLILISLVIYPFIGTLPDEFVLCAYPVIFLPYPYVDRKDINPGEVD